MRVNIRRSLFFLCSYGDLWCFLSNNTLDALQRLRGGARIITAGTMQSKVLVENCSKTFKGLTLLIRLLTRTTTTATITTTTAAVTPPTTAA